MMVKSKGKQFLKACSQFYHQTGSSGEVRIGKIWVCLMEGPKGFDKGVKGRFKAFDQRNSVK